MNRKYHDKPPSEGILEFNIDIPPISREARRKHKDAIIRSIREITTNYEYIITEDVQIDIIWKVSEQIRYETGGTADNIIKPILDALSGPSGLIIDDCQVQYISCLWLDYGDVPEHFDIKMKFDADGWLLKSDLIFVQLEKGLCVPISFKNNNCVKLLLESHEAMLKHRNTLMVNGWSYNEARNVMSLQRLFHISRVNRFPTYKISELREMLSNNGIQTGAAVPRR